MRIAITPSLNASSRPLFIPGLHLISSRVNHTSRWISSEGDRMGTALFLSLRAAHVLLAAVWLGATVFTSILLMPVIEGSGPIGGQIMQSLENKGMTAFFARDGWHHRPDRDLSVLAFHRRVRSRSQPEPCRHGVRDRRRLRSPCRDHRRIRDRPFIEEDARVDGTAAESVGGAEGRR